MNKQRVVIEISTDVDPSELLDAALEFGKNIVEAHGGEFDDANGAWVQDAPGPDITPSSLTSNYKNYMIRNALKNIT